jgi:signal transduction histidine kinase
MNHLDPQLTPKDILLVDDTPNNLRLLSKLLTEQGYAVRKALNGQRAIQSALAELPDLILLDINMPEMDGYQVCEILKAEPKTCQVPIIFISALNETLDKVKAFQIGGADYITKPFEIEEVLARVNHQLKICQLTRQLDQQVQQRTRELEQAQIKLIQQEKMSTLGQMMAGIAHEINNPLGFISSNIEHLKTDIQDIFDLLNLYLDKIPDPDLEIQQKILEIDLDFLQKDLPQVIISMREGTERIRSLSQSLRTFARSDRITKMEFDLHESLNSTLTILKHRLKANENRPAIAVVKDYGELPLVNCYPSQLNQVFMNLMANAIDAIDEVKPHPKPTIWIRTTCQRDRQPLDVSVEIRDNGIGMTATTKEQAFKHLFTTKPIGKGTGLGLSIVQQIMVDNHGGTIDFQSQIGEGTSFVMKLPAIGLANSGDAIDAWQSQASIA